MAPPFIGIGKTLEDLQETILHNFIALLCLLCFFRLQGLNVLLLSYWYATTGKLLPCQFRRKKAS